MRMPWQDGIDADAGADGATRVRRWRRALARVRFPGGAAPRPPEQSATPVVADVADAPDAPRRPGIVAVAIARTLIAIAFALGGDRPRRPRRRR